MQMRFPTLARISCNPQATPYEVLHVLFDLQEVIKNQNLTLNKEFREKRLIAIQKDAILQRKIADTNIEHNLWDEEDQMDEVKIRECREANNPLPFSEEENKMLIAAMDDYDEASSEMMQISSALKQNSVALDEVNREIGYKRVLLKGVE